MPYAVGHVTKLTMTWRDSRFEGLMKNMFHYRGVEATQSTTQMAAFIASEAIPLYFARWRASLDSNTFLHRIQIENLTDLDEPTQERVLPDDTYTGDLVTVADSSVPQACACITRKSFRRGRVAIGHTYFGPLCSNYITAGRIDADPLLLPDLADVIACIGDPLSDPVTGWSARPCITNADGSNVVPNSDVRVQTLADKVVFLKSRRPGVGE